MKISFATTCRDRLDDLRQTLMHNLSLLNLGEELVLLDYNSGDDLRAYVAGLPRHAFDRGLKFYSERTAPRFLMSHAKNVAHLLATGQVIVNLDADNLLDPNYLQEVRTANWAENVMLYPLEGSGGFKGRTAVRADIFRVAGGYDEAFDRGYGYEEIDLYKRIRALGYKVAHVVIDPASAIKTPEALKVAGQKFPGESSKQSSDSHMALSSENLRRRRLVANRGRPWGDANVFDLNNRMMVIGRMSDAVERAAV